MGSSAISLGLGLGGGKSATSSGTSGGGGTPYVNEYSVSFDATNDYVAIASGLESTINSASALTISTWVKINKWQSTLFSSGTSGTNGIWLLPYSSNSFFFSVRNGASTAITVNPSTNFTLNNWHHVCGVLDGSNSKLYFDGSVVGSGTLPSLGSTGGSNPSIGSFQRGSFFTGGLIDEVAIFNTALSASDITDIYNSGVPNDIGTNGLNLNPAGWWRMGDGTEAGSGTTVYDMSLSSNSNNGTLKNIASPNGFVTDVPS